MFVAESETKLRHIERSEHSFNYTNTGDLGPVVAGGSFRSMSDP